MQREASQPHGMIDCRAEVVDGVEQGAVEVEDDEFGVHGFKKRCFIPQMYKYSIH